MPITLQPGEDRPLSVQLTPIPVEPARLFGYVTDDTGAAIAGAVVELSGAFVYSGVTDGTGYYQITGIVPGTYDGLVTAAGYIDYPF